VSVKMANRACFICASAAAGQPALQVMIERIVEFEKPVYMTYEIIFQAASQ